MRLEVYTLPTFWACALINDDTGGMSDDDIARMERWLDATFEHGAHCVDVSEEDAGFMRWHDASRLVLACECSTYTFDVEERPCSIINPDKENPL